MNILVMRGIVTIGNLANGSLFMHGDTIALKSEYRTDNGACECHIVGSGEMFWGGAKSAEELNKIYVTPIMITKK